MSDCEASGFHCRIQALAIAICDAIHSGVSRCLTVPHRKHSNFSATNSPACWHRRLHISCRHSWNHLLSWHPEQWQDNQVRALTVKHQTLSNIIKHSIKHHSTPHSSSHVAVSTLAAFFSRRSARRLRQVAEALQEFVHLSLEDLR